MGGTTAVLFLAVSFVLCNAIDLPILQQPEGSQDVVPSQGVLKCRLQGSYAGDVTYSWYKDGKLVDTADSKNYKMDAGDLHIKGTSEDGDYQCKAKTIYGTASTRVITLKEERSELPPVTKKAHNPTEGKPFQLECPVGDMYPKPNIEWTKGKKDGESEKFLDRRITMSPDGTLWFSNVTQEDVGDVYVCHVTSGKKPSRVAAEHSVESVKQSQEQNGELVPQYLSQDLVAKLNDVTMIYCIYGGTPLAHPDWEKDGVNVNGEPHDRVTRYNRSSGRRLLIKQTLLEDQGRYKCTVSNGVGKEHVHDMMLTVVESPKFLEQPQKHIDLKEGQALELPCVVLGTPAPKLTLTYNGKFLSSDARITSNLSTEGRVSKAVVAIAETRKSDTGYYGCTADNGQGSTYAETLVVVS